MSNIELKPCPFCGGHVELEQTSSYYNEQYGVRKWWGVVCRSTKNQGGTCAIQSIPSASEEAAVNRWNMRTDPEIDQLKDEIKSLRKDAERFRFIQQDADSGMRRIYGDDWLSVVDTGGFQG